MKKSYSKPVVGFEAFQIDAAIAGSCKDPSAQGVGGYWKHIPINHYENSCSYAEGQFFNFFNCSMDLTGPEFDGNDTICYHGPILSGGIVFVCS